MNNETFLNERIEVLAAFGDGLNRCRPLRFRRASGREIEVSEIGLAYPTKQGKRTLHIFDITDGATDYRLEFDAERLIWCLTREADHGL